MVVMSIMALMAVLGLAAIIDVNNNVIADHVAQDLLSGMRETQNKALSVAADPQVPDTFPSAWVVKIDKSAGITTWYVNPPTKLNPEFSFNSLSSLGSDYNYVVTDVSVGNVSVGASPVYLVYNTPFGNYIEMDENDVTKLRSDSICYASASEPLCNIPRDIPHSLQIQNSNGTDVRIGQNTVEVAIQFRNSTRVIRIESNGEVNIK